MEQPSSLSFHLSCEHPFWSVSLFRSRWRIVILGAPCAGPFPFFFFSYKSCSTDITGHVGWEQGLESKARLAGTRQPDNAACVLLKRQLEWNFKSSLQLFPVFFFFSFPSSRPQFLSLWNCFSLLVCLPCSSGSLGNQGAVIAGLADPLFMVGLGEISWSAVHSFTQGLCCKKKSLSIICYLLFRVVIVVWTLTFDMSFVALSKNGVNCRCCNDSKTTYFSFLTLQKKRFISEI